MTKRFHILAALLAAPLVHAQTQPSNPPDPTVRPVPAVPSTVAPAVPSTSPVPATGYFNPPPDTTLPGTLTTPGLSTLPGVTPESRSAATGGTAPRSILDPTAPLGASGSSLSSPSRMCSPGSLSNPC